MTAKRNRRSRLHRAGVLCRPVSNRPASSAAVPALLLALLALAAAAVAPGAASAVYAVGDTVADFTLPGLDGSDHSLGELRGRVVLLNFFATWCLGCNEEAAGLENDIWQVYRDRGLSVVAVDMQEPAPLVDGWRQARGVTYTIWLAPDWSLFGLFTQADGIPYNTVIDTRGVLRYSSPGFDPAALTAVVQSLLDTQVPVTATAWGTVKRLYR